MNADRSGYMSPSDQGRGAHPVPVNTRHVEETLAISRPELLLLYP